MSTNTKQQIFSAFIKVLETKPFDKITIKDIVDECDINRNTFYYYYTDIYELLEEVFKLEADDLQLKGRWDTGFYNLLNTCYANKKIIGNICASRSYEYLESYLFKFGRKYTSDYVHNLTEGKNIDESTLEFLISFYQYAINGTLAEWFRTGMQESPRKIMKQYLIATNGLFTSIEMAERKKKS